MFEFFNLFLYDADFFVKVLGVIAVIVILIVMIKKNLVVFSSENDTDDKSTIKFEVANTKSQDN